MANTKARVKRKIKSREKRKEKRMEMRMATHKPSTDQLLSAQVSALNLSDRTVYKAPSPSIIFATKSLKMGPERKAWISKYRGKLRADHPELLAHEIDDMTEEAWKQYAPVFEDHLSRALKVREGKRYRKKQNKRNPGFAEQRALRVTELSDQMRRSNPTMSSEEAKNQAKWLEQQEIIDAADKALLRRMEDREAAKIAKREKKARAAAAGQIGNYQKANERQTTKQFSKVGNAQVDEAGEEEDDYEPPESFEEPTKCAGAAFPEIKLEQNSGEEDDYEPPGPFDNPQGGYNAASAFRIQQQTTGANKVLAAYERANQGPEASVPKDTKPKTENTTRAMRGMYTQHKNALRAEIRNFQAERIEGGGKRALKADARENKDEARLAEFQKQEAVRLERLYQTVVKRENMNKWLQQLTLDEPEEPEVMLDEEMDESQEREQPRDKAEIEHMHTERDAMEF